MLASCYSRPNICRDFPIPTGDSIGATPPVSGRPNPLVTIAHDLRGPLANLALLVEAIAEDAATRGSRRVAGNAAKAQRIIDRLDTMMTTMLERARDGGDDLRPTPTAVDLTDLVETVVGLNQPFARQRGVRLHCIVAEPLSVSGDAHLLMRAIDNLLGNAIGLTRAKGLVLCEAAPGDDGDVLIRISDDGPGLAADEIAVLFQPFSTVGRHAGRSRRSTGLGLTIVRQVAEVHGGTIDVQSNGPGRGSSFLLRLPGSPLHG